MSARYLDELNGRYGAVRGQVHSVVVEKDRDPRKIDHVWIEVQTGEPGLVQISLSTCSRQSRALGFDPQVRIGIVAADWIELPPAGLSRAAPLDYAQIEAARPVEFITHERTQLELLMVDKARRSVFVEAWGEFYRRGHFGLHQVHSRRASAAVPRDLIGQDGAVRFYFEAPQVSELLLCKFAGQP